MPKPYRVFWGILSIPVLLIFISPNYLILGVSLCAGLGGLLLSVIVHQYPGRFRAASRLSEERKKETKLKWLSNSYLVNNMLFAIFSLLVYTIVDISFYNVNNAVFPTEIQLASFLGIFFAISNGFDLLCRGVVGPIVINKFGVRTGLLMRAIAVGCVALTIFLLLPWKIDFYTIFLLVALMKLFDEGISNSILRQAVLILYQPLLPRLRLLLQSKIELLVIPLSTITASVAFILIQHYFKLNLSYITALIILLNIATIWVTFLLQKGYLDNLKQAIAKQFVALQTEVLDKNYGKYLLEKISHEAPHESVYCLELLEKADRSYFVQGLQLSLSHLNPLIKQAALLKLQHFQAEELIPAVKKVLREESALRSQALFALLFQKEKSLDAELIDPDSDEAILIGLPNTEDKLQKLIQASSSKDRIRAAKILGQSGGVKELLALFDDPDPAVVLAVIETVPQFDDVRLYRKLANALSQPTLRGAAMRAFILAKDKGLEVLTKQITTVPQWDILEVLDGCGYQGAEFTPYLIEMADHLKKLIRWTEQAGVGVLRETLIREIQATHERIFLLLRLMYPKKAIEDIAYYFNHGDIDKVSYAQELLGNLLNREHQIVLPLLTQQEFAAAPLNQGILEEILDCRAIWLRATVLYLIGHEQLKGLSQRVREAVHDPEKIVSETAQWSLRHL